MDSVVLPPAVKQRVCAARDGGCVEAAWRRSRYAPKKSARVNTLEQMIQQGPFKPGDPVEQVLLSLGPAEILQKAKEEQVAH